VSCVRTRKHRTAEDRARARDLNDELADIYDTWSKPVGTTAGFYVCECDDSECAEVVEISAASYRRSRARAVLAPGHESASAHHLFDHRFDHR